MIHKERLSIAEEMLCEHAGASDAESVEMDILQKRKVTDREANMAKLITRLYTLIHPAGNCKNRHEDWEEENEKLLTATH